MTIPYDVLLYIFAFVDNQELFNAALVNQELNAVASRYLYANVTLSFPLGWKSEDAKLPSGISGFMSASSPKYASLVRNLEVSGYFAGTSVHLKEVHDALLNGLKSFTNIQSVTICPETYEGNFFTEHLKILLECSTLRVLDVNSSCFDDELQQAMAISPANPPSALAAITEDEEDEENPGDEEQVPPPLSKAELVASISGLTKLTLRDPSRRILQLLIPYWLNRLSKTLAELHLQDNCGSITPGVLRSALPQLQNIRSLSIGLSYSLTDRDLFGALSQLPQLQVLSVNYYLQHTSPPHFPVIRTLKSLTVQYQRPESRRHCDALCKWVRKAISQTHIESLSLVGDLIYEYPPSNPSFDGLIDHLISVHATRLKTLSLPSCFVGTRALERLCKTCSKLEQLSVGGRGANLQTFFDTASYRALPLLHTVSFSLLNENIFAHGLQDEFVSEIMKGYPMLRRLSMDLNGWKYSWTSDAYGKIVEFTEVREQ
ncbi:hypothetical protein PQX77_011100 [Marasmius sp. AFHP31]|nr:hypothetical protein PQX77_011100 [Marasmius sp. AFHP31]